MKKEACISFVEQDVSGKYPFEKSIKYTLQIDKQEVPVYCYAHVFKGNIVSLELNRTSENIKNMSSDIMLVFFAKVLESLREKEKSKITRIYTKLEYWEEICIKLPQGYSCKSIPIKKVLKKSYLLKKLRNILEKNNLYIYDYGCDLVTINKKRGQTNMILCGDLFLDVKLLE